MYLNNKQEAQLLHRIIDLKWQNNLKVGTDKPKL